LLVWGEGVDPGTGALVGGGATGALVGAGDMVGPGSISIPTKLGLLTGTPAKVSWTGHTGPFPLLDVGRVYYALTPYKIALHKMETRYEKATTSTAEERNHVRGK
jgi:hypothetical protein